MRWMSHGDLANKTKTNASNNINNAKNNINNATARLDKFLFEFRVRAVAQRDLSSLDMPLHLAGMPSLQQTFLHNSTIQKITSHSALLSWILKVVVIFTCSTGLIILYNHSRNYYTSISEKFPYLPTMSKHAMEDRELNVYSSRWGRVLKTCSEFESEITRHTVKMFDLVPPAPIGMNADLLVDRKNKFYWCKVPKAASTSWTSLLLSDREFSQMSRAIGQQHMYLRKLMPQPKTLAELKLIQGSFFSWMTVRHPFERLLSAYRDKFFQLKENRLEKTKATKFYNLYGKEIIAKYRKEGDVVSSQLKYKNIPTFPEFVEFVIHTDIETYNEHWLPYYILCTPCALNYTVIAKTETINQDSHYILQKINMSGNSVNQQETLSRIHKTGKRATSTTARSYFSMLNKEQVKALYDKYEIDLAMFGYEIEPYLSFAVNNLPPKYVATVKPVTV